MINLLTIAYVFMIFTSIYCLVYVTSFTALILSGFKKYFFIIFFILSVFVIPILYLMSMSECYIYTNMYPTLNYNFCLDNWREVRNIVIDLRREMSANHILNKEREREELREKLKQNIIIITNGEGLNE